MGTFESNLGKISKLWCGNNLTRWIILGFFTLVLSVELTHSLEENDTNTIPPTQSSSSTEPSTLPEILELDAVKKPDYTWNLINDKVHIFKISENSVNAGFEIAIHLKKCHFDGSESIKITSDGKENYWGCGPRTINSIDQAEVFTGRNIQIQNDRYNGDQYVVALAVIDGIDEVSIAPNFNVSDRKWKDRVKAVIIVNLYKDVSGNSCPDNMFNCRQALCPPTCCSDLQQYSSGGSKVKPTSSANIIATSTLFSTPAFWKGSPKSSNGARCISSTLECDDNPNCGVLSNNIDESNQICYPLKYCECQSICLTWNYVLTSLAIAVLFIITPTAIVFALFHRRNVALERARLLRMAAMRMADMRGEFTRDDPHNDRPPTYDEVYDIKEPPPCFCKAIAMQREYDLQQQMLSSNANGDTESQDSRRRNEEGSSEETVIENDGNIEFQNLGFQCSCSSVNQDDIPPSYIDVSSSSCNTSGGEGEHENNNSSNNRQQPEQTNNSSLETVNTNHVRNVDLDKEEEV